MGFWAWFYLTCVVVTLAHAHFPILPKRLIHHACGSEFIAASWGASFLARYFLGDPTPLAAYAIIDTATALAFLVLALRNEAVWAAICVIIHALMCALHLSFYLTGETSDTGYIWLLNSLFFAALLVINFAILAGRHSWGERIDDRFGSHLRGWTFSGVRNRSFQNYRKEHS